MWSAIKSDLFDFVSTIKEDTTTTLNKVLGEEGDEQEEQETLQSKLVADVRRTYETYANPLREHKLKEYERFKKKFLLSSYAEEIAQVLDAEPEVSRFYTELVPAQLTPAEFWARLFFRLQLVSRSGSANFEDEIDEEEEELVWESEVDHVSDASVPATSAADTNDADALRQRDNRINVLQEENSRLKSQVSYLLSRITELELLVQEQQSSAESAASVASLSSSTAGLLAATADEPSVLPSAAAVAAVPADTSSQSSGSSGSIVLVTAEGGTLTTHVDGPRLPTLHSASTSSSSSRAVSSPGRKETTGSAQSDDGSQPAILSPKDRAAAYLASLDDDEEDDWS